MTKECYKDSAAKTNELELARVALLSMKLAGELGDVRRTDILSERPSDVPEHVYSMNFARVVIV